MVSDADRDAGGRRMLAGLLAASHLMPLELLPARTAEHAQAAGFSQVLIYLGDLQCRVLRLLTGKGPDAGQETGGEDAELKMEGTPAGRAYQLGHVVPDDPAGPGRTVAGRWWVPLLNGAERLGVLRITTETDDERSREDMSRLASLVALIVHSKHSSSDSFARLTRSGPMNIAAEMQWHLMQPHSYADGRVVISASMEPAYQTSGDAFDYSTAGDVVHLAIFDAMGHDTAAGLSANLAMATCRNTRRQGAGLVEITERIEEALIEQYGQQRYVTGIQADLDTSTGVLSWVNRGHHPPILIRGNRGHTVLSCRPAHPMGTGLGLKAAVCREQLEPGDRIVLYTDGITEARTAGGAEFGLERFTDFILRHHADGLSVPETLRRLTRAVLDHHDGRLHDDATILLCEWLGPAESTAQAADRVGIHTPRPLQPDSNPEHARGRAR
ncbi:PP2C family protein-serine/threonine phosphatase [Streptomyces sp. TG1A-8]|uniref:PP2C family protein-serine/threonine phosphatase n=1 Tax=Streptomyces sp. TG1A-8 TaxID=3051385 RepID=UPI00265C81EF|nr:PP2C family protein-serine/threonine phosphatase [Streptomyces sp. TG1A-8]MDO0925306.1 PP2C family protein-serine/threonine phosphatase [Streptomyces sp. TG1A-8]